MELDDLFERKRNQQMHGYDRNYGHDDHYRRSHSYNGHSDIKQQLLSGLRNNPKLKSLLVVAAIVIVVVIILVIVLLLPLLLKLLSYLGENGIQGLIDTLWKGSK